MVGHTGKFRLRRLKGGRETLRGPWDDGVMGEIVAEDRQEGVERF